MPEVTARTPVGAAIQAAKEAVKQGENRQPDTGEVTTPQPAVTKPQDDSQRIAALARREKALRQQQRELQMLKQQLEMMRQPQAQAPDPNQQREKFLAEYRDRVANDPLAVVSELGLELQSLKDSQSSSQKILDAQKQADIEREKKSLRSQAMFLMNTSADYKLLKDMGDALGDPVDEAVAEFVLQSIESGEEVGVVDAAKAVQDYMIDRLLKGAAIPGVKEKLIETLGLKSAPAPQQEQQTTTLARTEQPAKPLTAKDRRQRAIWAGMGLDPNTGKPFQS